MLKILIAFLFVKQIFACDSCNPKANCVSQANSKLTLNCDNLYWFKSMQSLSNKQNGIYDQVYYEYDSNCNDLFTIKKLNSSDSGQSIYKSKAKLNDTTYACEFNLYVYDLTNYAGHLKVNEINKNLNDTSDEVVIKIDTFSVPINYSFSIESLPLDGLAANGAQLTKAEVKSCQPKNYSWLNCLESTQEVKLNLQKCQSSFSISLSSSINNLSIYANENSNIKPLEFNHQFKLIYPPKVKSETLNLKINKTIDSISLNCSLDCYSFSSSASDLNYKWHIVYKNNTNTTLNLTESDSTSILFLNSSQYDLSQIQSIKCEIIDAQIAYSNLAYSKESTTTFLLNDETITPTKPVNTAASLSSHSLNNNSIKMQFNLIILLIALVMRI